MQGKMRFVKGGMALLHADRFATQDSCTCELHPLRAAAAEPPRPAPVDTPGPALQTDR